jgi:hypothetical protein
MSDSMLGDDPQKTARDLQRALEGMTEQLGQVKASLRRGKRVVAALVVSLILDVALTIGVSVAAIQANDASGKASATITQLHASNLSACRQGNVNRRQDIAIWNKLLGDLAPPAVRTPKVAAELAGINKLIQVKDTPHDCSLIYRLHPGAAAQYGP